MPELNLENYHRARPLFADYPYQRALVFSVLDGCNPGRVFVDDTDSPAAAFVASATEFNFFAGQASCPRFLEEIKALVFNEMARSMATVFLSGPGEDWSGAIERLAQGYEGGWAKRAEFELPPSGAARLAGWRANIPAGLRVERIDRAAAEQIGWLSPFWGSVEGFLQRGVGFQVVGPQGTLSHCCSVVIGAGQVEIDVETAEAHRRRGLAWLAAAALIEDCLEQGLAPHWSCWSENHPSIALAEKLGFALAGYTPVRYAIIPH